MMDEEITLELWAEETRQHLEEFISAVRKDQSGCDPEYPISAGRGEWDEWYLMFSSGGE